MSQKKVDAYKAEKAKRKETIESNKKKQKVRSLGAKIAGLVVAAAIVVALVITGINSYKAHQSSLPVYDVNKYAVYDYSGILKETTEAPTEEQEEETPSQEQEEEASAEADTTEAP